MTALCMCSGEQYGSRRYDRSKVEELVSAVQTCVCDCEADGRLGTALRELPTLLRDVWNESISMAEVRDNSILQNWEFLAESSIAEEEPQQTCQPPARERRKASNDIVGQNEKAGHDMDWKQQVFRRDPSQGMKRTSSTPGIYADRRKLAEHRTQLSDDDNSFKPRGKKVKRATSTTSMAPPEWLKDRDARLQALHHSTGDLTTLLPELKLRQSRTRRGLTSPL